MANEITTDQMIEWAEDQAKYARRRSDIMTDYIMNVCDVEAHRLTREDYDRDAEIAEATAERLRLVRRMVEVVR